MNEVAVRRAQQGTFLWRRWLQAGTIAGLWACAAFVAMLVALMFMTEGRSWRSFARELTWAGPLYLGISVPLALFLSLVGHQVLLALRWLHPAAFVLCGTALGVLAGVAITFGTNPGVLILGCGLAGAAAGWGYHRAYDGPARVPSSS